MAIGDWVAAYGAVVATSLGILQFLDWRKRRQFLSLSVVQVYEDGQDFVVITLRNRGDRPTTLEMVGAGRLARPVLRPWKKMPLCVISMREASDNFGNDIGEPINQIVLQPGHQIYAAISRDEFNGGILADWKPRWSRVYDGIVIEHSQSDRMITDEIVWFE